MNENLLMTLDEAVHEVQGLLTGLDLTYIPEFDQYYATARAINRALRANALEVEWSYYSSVLAVGTAREGLREVSLRSSVRPRIMGDDAVRLVDRHGQVRVWAYILPRESLHKYQGRKEGLWVSVSRTALTFSRPLHRGEEGLTIQLPVMREPVMFRLPLRPIDPNAPIPPVPDDVREQEVDFDYPDAIILKAAALIAQSDPVLQPRVQTLEEQYKDVMYNLKERDERHTDSPYMNDFFVPISSDIYGAGPIRHNHPHADERWR